MRRSSYRVDVATTQSLLAGGALLVDVRREDDPAEALEGSIRIAPDEIPSRLDELPRARAVVLACT